MGGVGEWGSVLRRRSLCLNTGSKDSPQPYQDLRGKAFIAWNS